MSKKHNKKQKNPSELKECTLYVDGMHCSSCEVLIEKKLLKHEGIESVDASLSTGKVQMVYSGQRPDIDEINKDLKENGYQFSNKKFIKEKSHPAISFDDHGNLRINQKKLGKFINIFLIAAIILIGFFLLDKSKLATSISINSGSSMLVIFLFGLVAGTSSCAALVGGLLLSMAKNWNEVYIGEDSDMKKAQPFILFNVGRIISYAILGGVLGLIGSFFQINISLTAILTMAVSVMMIVLGLQMLDVEWAQKFRFALPKGITRFAANEENFKGKFMPFVTGALTFFLPCGFTIAAQGLALSSGNFLTGSLIMLFFALGTLPMLGLISLSSIKLNSKPHFTAKFNYVAGLLVLFFAIYNFNSQLNVLGLPSASDINIASIFGGGTPASADLPEIIEGKQILKMTVTGAGYAPSYLKVKAGIPVKWQVEGKGPLGCANVLTAKFLPGNVALKQGVTEVEFTPPPVGKYKFTCSMGMVVGTLEVVD
jgi:uncharacterized protein